MTDENNNKECVLEVEGVESNLGDWICLSSRDFRVELKLAVLPDGVTFNGLVSEVKKLTLENIRLSVVAKENKDEIRRLREHLRSV